MISSESPSATPIKHCMISVAASSRERCLMSSSWLAYSCLRFIDKGFPGCGTGAVFVDAKTTVSRRRLLWNAHFPVAPLRFVRIRRNGGMHGRVHAGGLKGGVGQIAESYRVSALVLHDHPHEICK
jgi:hypothetical protein